MMFRLYYSAADIRNALKELGPPATLGEATIKSAAETLAALFDQAQEDGWFKFWMAASPEAALQGGLPVVSIEWRQEEVDREA